MVAVIGSIDFPGEVEIFSDELLGIIPITGVDYSAIALGVDSNGGTLPNPAIQIVDDFGNTLAFNDNSFLGGRDPLIPSFSIPFGTLNPSFNVLIGDLTGGIGTYTLIVDQAGIPFPAIIEDPFPISNSPF